MKKAWAVEVRKARALGVAEETLLACVWRDCGRRFVIFGGIIFW